MATGDLSPILQQTFRNKILGREETLELIARSQRGDKAACDKLVRHNIRFVYQVAHRFKGWMPVEDLVQEGLCGLVKAINDFDVTTNNSLTTYSKWWIVSYMRRAITHSTGMRETITNGRKSRSQLAIARDRFTSTDETINSGSGTMRIGDTLTCQAPLADERYHAEQIRRKVRKEVRKEQHGARDDRIMLRLADKDNHPDLTLETIGEEFDISRERVRQLEIRIRSRLAANPKLKKLAGDL